MPRYCYKCPSCGEQATEFRPVARRNRRRPVCLKCPTTGRDGAPVMDRDIKTELSSLGPDFSMKYAKECVDDTMGVHPDQVPEHRRRHPNIRLNNEGSILIGDHAERLSTIKELQKAFTEE